MDVAYAESYRCLWDRHWWWRSRESYVRSALDRVATDGRIGRILDVGCGDGLFFDALGQYGEVEGLEADPSLVSESRRERIEVGRLDEDFRPDRPFDLALMLDVLEHIEDDRSALVALRRSIRPGGRLLLTVPANPWLWSRHDEVNAHFRRYTARSLRGVLESSGFSVLDLRPFFAWTVAPMLMRKWLSPAGRGERDYEVSIPPAPINRLLASISRAEHRLTARFGCPWGSSLFALSEA